MSTDAPATPTTDVYAPQGDAQSNIGPDGKPLIGPPAKTAVYEAGLPFYAPTLKLGDKGPAVQALQTLMHASLGTLVKGKVDGVYGSSTAADVHRFKTYNPRVGHSPSGDFWEVLDWQIAEKIVLSHTQILTYLKAAQAASKVDPKTALRNNIVAAAWLGYNNRARIYYAEIRPYPESLDLAIHGTIQTDCSGFVTLCYKHANAPDPNGFGYNGYGYTGTLQQHGKLISQSQLQPGDLCFYGDQGGGIAVHTAIYVGKGMVISNGRYPMDYAPTNLNGGLPWNSARSYIN